jgi:hypothetical protein
MKTKHDIYLYDKKSLEMKRISSLWLWIPLSLLLILSLSAGLLFVSDTIIVNNEGTYAISHENHFSEELLKDYIEELNIAFPEIVFAQAKLESNNFKSRIFKENNNLFGMKKAVVRSTTASGEQYNHALYASWKESVLDYALWSCRYLSNIKTKEQYLSYLGNNYAEDSMYVKKLKTLIK